LRRSLVVFALLVTVAAASELTFYGKINNGFTVPSILFPVVFCAYPPSYVIAHLCYT
jgi:hypothetical protein